MRREEKRREEKRRGKWQVVALSFVAPLILFSCGGGSGSSGSSESTSPVTYYGAASAGDLAKFTLNGTTLYYEVKGPVFGDKKGSFPVSVYKQKPFYKGEENGTPVYMMLSGNIAFADVILDGNDTFVVGLKSSGNLTSEDVAGTNSTGKNYVFVEVYSNGSVGGGIINLRPDGNWTLYGPTEKQEDNGTWNIVDGAYVNATDSAGTSYNVVIKPGVSRAGFVVDLPGGFGIGLEQKPLTQADVAGTYSFYSYNVDKSGSLNNGEDCFGTVKVYYDNSTGEYKYSSQYNCEDSGAGTENGTITLNKFCVPTDPTTCFTVNGTAMFTDADGNSGYLFIDPEDGYFMGVKLDSTGNISEYIIGSNK
jgi:hypothetical protein